MEYKKQLQSLKKAYSKGENVLQYFRDLNNTAFNSDESILIGYDLQAGRYTEILKDEKTLAFHTEYTSALAGIIDELDGATVMEVGVGEATTLTHVLKQLKKKPTKAYGFDLSWSRIKYAREYAKSYDADADMMLFTGDLFSTPIKDDSVDIVYTSHSLEPNGGKEREALVELYRISKNYLVLLEPSYELGGQEAKDYIKKQGYVSDLYATAKDLGYNIVEHRLFEHTANSLNPTGIIIIEKRKSESDVENILSCPLTHTDLKEIRGNYYSEESMLLYPIIDDIPCLLPANAIIAAKYCD